MGKGLKYIAMLGCLCLLVQAGPRPADGEIPLVPARDSLWGRLNNKMSVIKIDYIEKKVGNTQN